MNGLYISQDLSHASGIQSKIIKQIELFEKNDITMDTHINPKRTYLHLLINILPFFSKQYFKTNLINWNKYDFVYIRKGAIFDKSFIQLIKKAKQVNPKIKIIVEIPTFPYMNEFKGILKIIILIKENRWVPSLREYVDRFVTYSDDRKIFDIECINISNAYDYNLKPIFVNRDSQEINLLAVASLTFYHGYDRIIRGLKHYYESDVENKEKISFTLVGDGAVLNKYKKMIKEYKLENIVFLEGKKPIEELKHYYMNADIGIDSLGRHRSGITYNSSLKGKEYLAYGLPVVSGVKTELDDMNFKYYYRVPADDSAVNIQKIIHWYRKILNNEERINISEEIYEFGKKNFTFEKTFKPVIKFCKET